MKLIAQVKLQPTETQAEALRKTTSAWNEAANYISEQAWMRKSFRAYDLHHATYYTISTTRSDRYLVKPLLLPHVAPRLTYSCQAIAERPWM